LKISLKEHQLGLTGDGWQTLQSQITERQKSILTGLKEGKTVEFLAKSLGIKTNQVVSEWSQVYLAAQSLRTGGKDDA
jgi:DNA-binding NarL/FixJ family response regulator